MTAYTFVVEMNFAGAVWTDITADVRTSPITFSHGKDGTAPKDRVADTGVLSFVLKN
jgi:hypothetical protein